MCGIAVVEPFIDRSVKNTIGTACTFDKWTKCKFSHNLSFHMYSALAGACKHSINNMEIIVNKK